MDYGVLTQKYKQLQRLRPLSPALVRNLEEWFRVELTYSSNAIEGNTLTRAETAVVIERGLTVGGKSLKEHLEAMNHAAALDIVYRLAAQKAHKLQESELLSLHALILKGIDEKSAGYYRSVPVRISGSAVVLPNPRKVPELMEDFCKWLSEKNHLHPIAFATEAHYRLVTIHPFTDGNGRTARLLMNLLLMMQGYPPAIIRPRDRLAYINALETAQLGGAKTAYEKLMMQAVSRSLDIYLNAAKGKTAKPQEDKLLKIGQIAKLCGETVPTLRFWTKEGLIPIAEITPAGYQLYAKETMNRIRTIQHLKKQRLTLREILERL